MTPLFWLLLGLAVAGSAALALRRLPPRQVLALSLLAVAAGLAALRQVVLAVPLAALGLKLWRDVARATPAPGGRSQVESPGLRMTLDHDSGALDGEVLAGPFAGARLSGLSPEQLGRLHGDFEAAGDADSLALLLAWLDRAGKARAESAAPPTDGAMSEAEALSVLGLAPGASIDEVRAAYRRLMKRVHPDLGGSGALATMLNKAKQVLDPG